MTRTKQDGPKGGGGGGGRISLHPSSDLLRLFPLIALPSYFVTPVVKTKLFVALQLLDVEGILLTICFTM